ncbi:MAG: hypothetical protein Q9207_000656 [Kuettlingeria erythrocarpa]
MAASIIPLLGRMALVHLIMLWGTNNAKTDGLTALNIHHREIGSRLVLVSRILYAAFLWIAKFTVSEFLKRLTSQVWRRQYEVGLQCIRWFLAVTFVAVVIATLAECQPFNDYWQVVPDPGAKCRQGYAQLITMGTSDVITDLLLVAFPIPIVLKSHLAAKRKVSLVLLFSLSLILIAITIYRVIEVVHRHSDQQFRTLLASLEILAAAAVSNALVLGSFVRDRGVKKQRYRFDSVGGNSSLDRAGTGTRPRVLTAQAWGSDADLAGELCIRIAPDLEKEQPASVKARPAPLALPTASHAKNLTPHVGHSNWNFPNERDERMRMDAGDSDGNNQKAGPSPGEAEVVTPRRTSFFDVGGLLEHDEVSLKNKREPEHLVLETSSAPLRHDVPHALSLDASGLETYRRGSCSFMADMGAPQPMQDQSAPVVRNFSRPTSPTFRSPQYMPTIPQSSERHVQTQVPPARSDTHIGEPGSGLRDVGGLLD